MQLSDEHREQPGNQIDTRTGRGLVFVVGCPRSGTTWVQRLLASHPQISTGQESFLFNRYVSPLLKAWRSHLEIGENRRGGLGLPTYMDSAAFHKILKNYLSELLGQMIDGIPQGQLFLEKTPDHGLVLSDIAELLPEAKFINIVRSPRAVASSIMKISDNWGSDWAHPGPVKAIRFWRRHVDAAANNLKTLPDHCSLEFQYETIRRDTTGELGKMFDFLDLEWTSSDVANIVSTNSLEKSRRGEGTTIPIRGEIASMTGRSTVQDPASFVGSGTLNEWAPEVSVIKRLIGEAYLRLAARKSTPSAKFIKTYL